MWNYEKDAGDTGNVSQSGSMSESTEPEFISGPKTNRQKGFFVEFVGFKCFQI